MKINLLPLALRRHSYPHRVMIACAAAVLVVCVPVAVYSYYLIQGVGSLRAEVAALETRVTSLAPLELLLQERVNLEGELARIQETVVPEHDKLVPLLDEVARLLPDGVYVENLALVEQRLSLSGVMPTYAHVAELLRVLAGSRFFADPVLGALSEGSEGHNFSIAALVREIVP